MNPQFEKTVIKLTLLKKQIQSTILSGDMALAEECISILREYGMCEYCKAYRLSLTEHFNGVCDDCPCHKLGEKILGRPRSYNGCYVIGSYRDLVKTAYWFREDPTTETVQAVVKCIDRVLETMEENKSVL